ncbi:hypothetical protein BV25DRAFT_1843152 [Artomyces pyxidatus]|uniref:Uncharacterized protein n=1 Tax=Artomyces pyxidatus TaxID=48021 RepID=A0ACB8SFX6_9AGAM|nr:hypothetical protein BV25DRAFT_1843152 [Artomyces pyxidatus]
MTMSPLELPAQLWRWYVDYLWNYERDSWVASTASTFRVLAILTILPGILLTLLDVTSYVIARTLGDPTASTSVPPPETPAPAPPRIVVHPFDGEERLAGVGVFSPAASQPGSPTLSRAAPRGDETEGEGEGSLGESFALLDREDGGGDGAVQMRKRVRPVDLGEAEA